MSCLVSLWGCRMVMTVSGKELSVSVGYRLPLPLYEEAEREAKKRGVRLSVILRRATAAGLAILAGDGHLVADLTQQGVLNE